MGNTRVALIVLCLSLLGTLCSSKVFILKNQCSFTIWPGVFSSNAVSGLRNGGFALQSGSSVQLSAPPSWSGRFWGRTGCTFDASGIGHCSTGDCGGTIECNAGGAPPATLVEFTIGKTSDEKDFYDVSLVDGYNIKTRVDAMGGSGDCNYAGCDNDLNSICPTELEVVSSGVVVACKSACAAFNKPEYCCTGNFATPTTCTPTRYSKIFKEACPTAYSYAFDDASSTRTCSGSDYLITFCAT